MQRKRTDYIIAVKISAQINRHKKFAPQAAPKTAVVAKENLRMGKGQRRLIHLVEEAVAVTSDVRSEEAEVFSKYQSQMQ